MITIGSFAFAITTPYPVASAALHPAATRAPRPRAARTAPRVARPRRPSSSSSSAASASSRWADLGRADDRRGHAGPVQQPRERHLRAAARRARAATSPSRSTTVEVDLGRVERVAERVRAGARRQLLALAASGCPRAARARAGSTAARRRPGRCTAGSSRAPPRGRRGCSGSASRRSASSRCVRRLPAPSRTATRTCCSRRCSAPCPALTTSWSASIVSSIGVDGSQRWIW